MKKEINKEFNFIKLTADEGKYLTNKNETIENYYATKTIYLPISENIENYIEIDDGEHKNNLNKQKEYFEEKDKTLEI